MRVTGFLIEKDGSTAGADRETVQRLLDKGELLWLDLYRPDADELGMLATVFGIHHLAIDDAAKFGQRPKLEDYDDFTQLVAYGVQDGTDDLVEVHFFYSTRYLVTVRVLRPELRLDGRAPRRPGPIPGARAGERAGRRGGHADPLPPPRLAVSMRRAPGRR